MNTMDHIQLDRLALLNELDDLHAQLPELEIELDRIQAAMGAVNVGNNLYAMWAMPSSTGGWM